MPCPSTLEVQPTGPVAGGTCNVRGSGCNGDDTSIWTGPGLPLVGDGTIHAASCDEKKSFSRVPCRLTTARLPVTGMSAADAAVARAQTKTVIRYGRCMRTPSMVLTRVPRACQCK